jgi:hypothetical protein
VIVAGDLVWADHGGAVDLAEHPLAGAVLGERAQARLHGRVALDPPIVLAKGQDLIALRIREIAEQKGIPVIEDKPLASRGCAGR